MCYRPDLETASFFFFFFFFFFKRKQNSNKLATLSACHYSLPLILGFNSILNVEIVIFVVADIYIYFFFFFFFCTHFIFSFSLSLSLSLSGVIWHQSSTRVLAVYAFQGFVFFISLFVYCFKELSLCHRPPPPTLFLPGIYLTILLFFYYFAAAAAAAILMLSLLLSLLLSERDGLVPQVHFSSPLKKKTTTKKKKYCLSCDIIIIWKQNQNCHWSDCCRPNNNSFSCRYWKECVFSESKPHRQRNFPCFHFTRLKKIFGKGLAYLN